MELSSKWPVKELCEAMDISRSGFYKFKYRLAHPTDRVKKRMDNILLFEKYHEKYPSHGYRWLNAKIRLDLGLVMSDQYAHRCCKFAGILSQSKHYKYKKNNEEKRTFDNLVMASINMDGPLQVVVSDMTAFYVKSVYRELTLYMDLWDNEIVGYGLSNRKGDVDTYYNGLQQVVEKKKGLDGLKTILHTDHGSVYSSKSFNELLPQYRITHSMSRVGTPTDNGAMEAINGWAKTEMFIDFHIQDTDDVPKFVERYIKFFNEERPSYALGYLTPKAYKELYANNPNCPKKPSRIKYAKKQKAIEQSQKEQKDEKVSINC